MKKSEGYFRVIFLLIFLFGYICFSKAQEGQEGNNQFHYVIMGQVKNGDKVKISLYIPSRGMENRQTVTIEDGKYKFEGDADGIELAEILFEKAIVKFRGSQYVLPVFIEKDTVQIDFTVKKTKPEWYVCENKEVKSGENNLFYSRTRKKIKLYGVNESTHLNDSMQQYVYSAAKKSILDSYEELYYLDEHIYVSLYVFSRIIVDPDTFNKKYLTEAEKKRLKYFFDGIDPSVFDTKEYRFVKDKIEFLTSDLEADEQKTFKNFMLLNSTGTETSIEDVIKNHKITVLDFWWSGCSPCRRFNKETAKVYNKLKEKGIEIISINSDRGKDRWKFASDKDGISWINLYAGYKSEIVSYYRVSRYPTMFIFNDKLELIGGDVLNPLDLLDYLGK